MLIKYKNRKLEKTVASLTNIKNTYGTQAKLVNQRKNELEAAPNLQTMRSLVAANCHELTGKYKGKLAVNISVNHRLIFEPDHHPIPIKNDGGLDWLLVTAITILVIGEDYH